MARPPRSEENAPREAGERSQESRGGKFIYGRGKFIYHGRWGDHPRLRGIYSRDEIICGNGLPSLGRGRDARRDLVHELGDRRRAVHEGVGAFRHQDEEGLDRGGAEDVRATPRAGRGTLSPRQAGVAGGSGRDPGGARCRFSLTRPSGSTTSRARPRPRRIVWTPSSAALPWWWRTW